MQEHKVPHYRVMLGLPGIPDPLTIAAPCSAQEIAEQVRATVKASTIYIEVEVEVDLSAGLVTVRADGVGGELVAVGDITGPGVGSGAVPVQGAAPEPAEVTAIVGTVRALLAAGWVVDTADPLDGGCVERCMDHPSGLAIVASTDTSGTSNLTLKGLDLSQVAGAIRGAGLAPAAADQAPGDPKRAALVAGLRELADWYETHPDMPLPARPDFHYSVLADDDTAGIGEVERIAAQLGVDATSDGEGSASVTRQFGAVTFKASYVSLARMASWDALTSYSGSVVPDTEAAAR